MRDIAVVVVDAEEEHDQTRDEQHDKPRALREFRHGENDHDDAGDERAKTTQRHLGPPMRIMMEYRGLGFDHLPGFHVSCFPDAHDHTRLRHREAQEYADGVQGDQRGGFGPEEHDQDRCQDAEQHDTPRKDQP